MAARRRRRGLRASPRRRRRVRRNYMNAGMLMNPRRRRRARRSYRRRRAYAMNPRRRSMRRRSYRRHYRRNPRLMGFSLPPLDAVLGVGAGVVVPPIVTGYILKMLPAEWSSNRGMYWVVKAASVFLPSMAVRQLWSRRVGNFMLIGGVASLAIDAVREFLPGVLPGMGSQPFLGKYYGSNGRLGAYYERVTSEVPYGRPKASLPPILDNVPERLSPGARF